VPLWRYSAQASNSWILFVLPPLVDADSVTEIGAYPSLPSLEQASGLQLDRFLNKLQGIQKNMKGRLVKRLRIHLLVC